MDLKTMEGKLDSFSYRTPELFVQDIALIVSNCREYNTENSTYFRCAQVVERKLKELMLQFGFSSALEACGMRIESSTTDGAGQAAANSAVPAGSTITATANTDSTSNPVL